VRFPLLAQKVREKWGTLSGRDSLGANILFLIFIFIFLIVIQ